MPYLRSRVSLEDTLQNPQLLPETVGVLPSLSFIKVSKLAGPWILRAAMFHASEHYGQAHAVVVAIPLVSNQYTSMKSPFLPRYTTRKNTYTWSSTSGFVDRELLQQFLVTRSAAVRSCQLEKCLNLTAEDVDELCEVVGDVVCWDEVEPDEDEDEDE